MPLLQSIVDFNRQLVSVNSIFCKLFAKSSTELIVSKGNVDATGQCGCLYIDCFRERHENMEIMWKKVTMHHS